MHRTSTPSPQKTSQQTLKNTRFMWPPEAPPTTKWTIEYSTSTHRGLVCILFMAHYIPRFDGLCSYIYNTPSALVATFKLLWRVAHTLLVSLSPIFLEPVTNTFVQTHKHTHTHRLQCTSSYTIQIVGNLWARKHISFWVRDDYFCVYVCVM